MLWGKPRPGHPEGAVGRHTIDVLDNVERFAADPLEREELRLIALLHDACKSQVLPGGPHHGKLARLLAEGYLDDERLLSVIERHDDAFRIYRSLHRPRRDRGLTRHLLNDLLAELRLQRIERLYLTFFRCDSLTGDKSQAPYDWFARETCHLLPVPIQGDAR